MKAVTYHGNRGLFAIIFNKRMCQPLKAVITAKFIVGEAVYGFENPITVNQ